MIIRINTVSFFTFTGLTGLFCPCVQFGRNVENLRDDVPWTTPCICHAIFVEGGMAVAAATAIFYGVDPRTSFLISEGLVFAWWMCGVYTGLVRQSLQKKYHLKVVILFTQCSIRSMRIHSFEPKACLILLLIAELAMWPLLGPLLPALVCLVSGAQGDEGPPFRKFCDANDCRQPSSCSTDEQACWWQQQRGLCCTILY